MKEAIFMKKFLCGFLAVAITMGFTGCGSSSSDSSATANAGELNLFVWTEYLPQSVLDKFTEETGIKVNTTTYSSNEDMLAKLKSEETGAFDIIQPSDYMVEQVIAQGLVQELDKSKLTCMDYFNSAYLNPSYDPDNTYSLPYLGGAGAIAVNTDVITDEIDSYDDLFNPDYANTLVVLDDYRSVIGMAAKAAGYDLNESDPANLEVVKEKVLSLKNNIKLYDSDSPKSSLISGDCNLGFCWSAEIALANAENPAIEIRFPSEGAYLFFDNWLITDGAKNAENAYTFLNFINEPENMQMVLEEYPYICANEAAVELMDDSYKNNEACNPPAEVIANGSYIQNLDSDTLAIYDSIWTELKK